MKLEKMLMIIGMVINMKNRKDGNEVVFDAPEIYMSMDELNFYCYIIYGCVYAVVPTTGKFTTCFVGEHIPKHKPCIISEHNGKLYMLDETDAVPTLDGEI